MALENWKRVTPGDYPDAPEWFFKFAAALNRTLEDVVGILQAGITTQNEKAEVFELQVFDSVPFEVFYENLRSNPDEMVVLWSSTAVTSTYWSMTGEGRATVTLTFSGTPTESQTVRLKVKGS